MFKLLLTLTLGVVLEILNIVTIPISVLTEQTSWGVDFPTLISNVINMFDTYVVPTLTFVFDFLPTQVKVVLVLYFNFYLIVNYIFEPAYKTIIRGLVLLKKLPFM